MDKKFYEFDNEFELNRHLKYWSDSRGKLCHRGENDISELPEELQRAYNELWKVGNQNGCIKYLVEYDSKYYIALVNEFDDCFADHNNVSMEEWYEIAKRNALELYHQDLFKNTVLVLGKGTGYDVVNYHEAIFLVPAMESEDVYGKIYDKIGETIDTIYLNVLDNEHNEKKYETLSSQDEKETNKTPIMLYATDKLLSLRKQLSSAIEEIDSVIGKNGQIQQNISTHEKQSEEINKSQKRSGPTNLYLTIL